MRGDRAPGSLYCCLKQLDSLQSMLLLELQVFLVERVDSIDHGLDKLNFRVSQAMLVGNVIGDAGLSTRLATGSTWLKGQGFAPLLQGIQTLLGPSGKVDVDRGSHAGAQVGGARVQVAKTSIQEELLARLLFDGISHSLDAIGQTLKYSTDIATLLHGDDSELVFLIDPGEEGLVLVVVDASALWPVTLHASRDEVLVARDKQEVVIHQLLTVGFLHAQEGVVVAGQLASQLGKCVLHQFLDLQPLLLGDSGRQAEAINAATDTDPGGLDWGRFVNVALDLADIHVRGVAEAVRETVVLGDDGVKDILEDFIRVLVSSVNAAVLIIEFNGTSNGLAESESAGFGLDATELLPFLWSDVLGDQAMGGLDGWEWWSRHS